MIIKGVNTRTHNGKTYRVLYGIPKNKKGGSVEQTYRYPISGWSASDARKHCKAHNGILFEPAIGKKGGESMRKLKMGMNDVAAESYPEYSEIVAKIYRYWYCTKCNHFEDISEKVVKKPKSCPECGAKMRLVPYKPRMKEGIGDRVQGSGYRVQGTGDKEAEISDDTSFDELKEKIQGLLGKNEQISELYNNYVVIRKKIPYSIKDEEVILGFGDTGESEIEIVKEAKDIDSRSYISFEVAEAKIIDKQTHKIEVTLICAGLSANKNFYPEEVLERDIDAFKGIKAYADHKMEKLGRSIGDLVGKYEKIRYENGKIKAVLHLYKTASRIWDILESDMSAIGLSIFAKLRVKPHKIDGEVCNYVVEIIKVHSVDVVSEPSAGGSFDKVIEGQVTVGELLWSAEARGQGKGVGGAIQKDGGAKYCVCPKCGYSQEHKKEGTSKSKSCNEIKCPKCGAQMVGSDTPKLGKRKKEVEMELKDLTRRIIEEETPKLFLEIRKDLKDANEVFEEKNKTLEGEKADLEKEKVDLEKEKEEWEKEKADLDKQIADKDKRNSDLEATETKRKKEDAIAKLLKNSKLDEKHISETFKEQLLAIEKEEEDQLIAEAKKLISDREKLVLVGTGKIKDMGATKEETEKPADEMTDEKAEALLKGQA